MPKLLTFARSLAVVGLIAPYTVVIAQELALADILKGTKEYPLAITPEELTTEFRAVKIEIQGSTGPYDSIMNLMMMSPSGSQQKNVFDALNLSQISWSKGDVVKVGNVQYLVSYKMDLSLNDVNRIASGGFGAERGAPTAKPIDKQLDLTEVMASLHPQSTASSSAQENPAELNPFALRLKLVKTDLISAITPAPQITKAALLEFYHLALGLGTPVELTPGSEAEPERPVAAKPAEPSGAALSQTQIASKKAATANNMKQICLATIMYMSDYDDVLPYAQSTTQVKMVTYPYIKNIDVWRTHNPKGGEIRFNISAGGINAADVEFPAETVLFYESQAWSDGTRVVGFFDGHVKSVSADQWQRLQSTLKLKLKKHAQPFPMSYGKGWKPGR